MDDYLRASKDGLKIVKDAGRKKGWTQTATPEWWWRASTTQATLKRFWRGRRIDGSAFRGICEAVGVNWKQVAELSQSQETELPVVSTAIATPSVPNLNFVGREGAIAYPHQNSEMPFLPELTALRCHCEKLVEKYENKWGGNFYIFEKGIIQEQIPVYASLYSDYTSYSKKLDLLQTLKSHSRTLLLGEPGSGKTTSIEKLCLEYARDFYRNTNQSQGTLFPIIIRLSTYTGNLLQSIRSSLNSMGMFQLEEDTFKINNFLQKLPCLILFDGLNEVNNTQRSTVISNIAQFLNTYPNHKYVITSRPPDELWRMLSPEDIEINLVIQPIDYEDTVRYLSLHLGEKIGRMAYTEVSAKFKDLLRLPLILWMFKEDVSQTKLNLESEGGVIDEVSLGASKLTPKNRGELYKRFMERFFIRETSKIEGQTTTIKWVKYHVLSNLALAMHKQKTLCLSYQEVFLIFNDSIKNIQGNISAVLLLDAIQKSGILIGESGLGFAHQTFQEFFAATALAQLSSETIENYVNDIWWNETIIFLSGIVGLESLDKFNELVSMTANVDPFLAMRCILEGRASVEGRNIVQQRLEPMLKSENWIERKKAVEGLGIVGDHSVVPKLAALLDDPNADVRDQAAVCLKDFAVPEAEAALIKALKDVSWTTRAKAAEALGRMKVVAAIPCLRSLLTSDMPRERGDATYSLILMKINAATPGIAELLQDQDKQVTTSVRFAIEISNSPNPIDVLSDNIKNKNPYIREKAAHILTRLRSINSIHLLRDLLEDSHSDVVIIAVQSIAKLDGIEYLPDVLKLLSHPVPFVREIAAFSCQIFGSKTAIPSLLPLLGDENAGVRFSAVRALGSLGDAGIINNIIPLLKDSSEVVRLHTVIALGSLCDLSMDIIDYLEPALTDTNSEIKEAAATAILLIKKRQRFKGFFQA